MHIREVIAASNTEHGGEPYSIETTFNAKDASKYFMTLHYFMLTTYNQLNLVVLDFPYSMVRPYAGHVMG